MTTHYTTSGNPQKLHRTLRTLAKRMLEEYGREDFVGEPIALENGKLRMLNNYEESLLTDEFTEISA